MSSSPHQNYKRIPNIPFYSQSARGINRSSRNQSSTITASRCVHVLVDVVKENVDNSWLVNAAFATVLLFAYTLLECDGSPEASRAATHDFALTDEFGVEFGAVKGEVDVEVDTVESPLRRVHAFKVFLEVLAAEI